MKKSVIYKIQSPNGSIYIGQTVNFRSRMNAHKNCKDDYKLNRSFKKYGFNNHIIEIIDEVPIEHSSLIETYNIWLYNSYENGLNSTPFGGCVFRGKRHSQESIDRISSKNKIKLKGRKFSNETRLKMSIVRKEKLRLGLIDHGRVGKIQLEESRIEMSKSKLKNHKFLTEEKIINMKKGILEGLTTKEISEKYNIKKHYINSIRYKDSYNWIKI